jgi:hypothetical protein
MNSWPDGLLLADHATDADRPGLCALSCGHPILRGQRVARLLTGQPVHTWCVAAMKPGG